MVDTYADDSTTDDPTGSSPDDHAGASTGDQSLSARLALLVFCAYLVVGFFVILFVVGDDRWFLGDEWTFLSGRKTTNIGDYFEPLNGHWVTLPLALYRGVFAVFGLHSYLPYQLGVILAHLTVVVLLRVVMIRTGVGPWISTLVASTFVLFGATEENIVWAFQVTLVAALAFGLVHLLLADRDGAFGRRDVAGLVAGLLSVMCSGVGVVMVMVVGIAVLLRRGWRLAALHTVPIAVVYATWYVIVRPSAVDGGVTFSSGEYVGKGSAYLWTGTSAIFTELAQSRLVGFVLAVGFVVGLLLAWVPMSWSALRRQMSMPVAMLAGVAVFLVTTLITAFDRGFLMGVDEAGSDRYLHISVALALPAVAVAFDALVRRWRLLTPVVVVVLLIGIPGNIDQFESTIIDRPYFDSQKRLIFGIGRTEEAAQVPGWVEPEQWFTPDLTVGWLRQADRAGKLPDALEPDGVTEQTWPIRLGLAHLREPIPDSLECRRTKSVDIEPRKGQELAVRDPVNIQLLKDGQPISGPVFYDPIAGGELISVELDGLELRIVPPISERDFTFCS